MQAIQQQTYNRKKTKAKDKREKRDANIVV